MHWSFLIIIKSNFTGSWEHGSLFISIVITHCRLLRVPVTFCFCFIWIFAFVFVCFSIEDRNDSPADPWISHKKLEFCSQH